MRFLDLQLIEAPDVLPVTPEEFTDHARLNGLTVDRQPELITRELNAATMRAEQYMRRALITQTLAGLYIPESDSPTAALIELPRGRVQSITSVESPAGAALDPAEWDFDGWNTITLAAAPGDRTVVTWVAGYGDQPEAVPDAIREGIYEYATLLYESRNGSRETKYRADAGITLPRMVQDLWRPYQIEVAG